MDKENLLKRTMQSQKKMLKKNDVLILSKTNIIKQ